MVFSRQTCYSGAAMKLTLRQHFARLAALPDYLPSANTLDADRAQEIALSFGDDLVFLTRDHAMANTYGEQRKTQADTRGEGAGQFPNAERLFYGYVYEMHREADADSQAARRREEFD